MSSKVTGAEKQSLYSYSALMGILNLIFAVFLLVARGVGRSIPDGVDPKDIALLGVTRPTATRETLSMTPFHRLESALSRLYTAGLGWRGYVLAIDALHDRHAERTGAADELRLGKLTERS